MDSLWNKLVISIAIEESILIHKMKLQKPYIESLTEKHTTLAQPPPPSQYLLQQPLAVVFFLRENCMMNLNLCVCLTLLYLSFSQKKKSEKNNALIFVQFLVVVNAGKLFD